jgi:hypothetical protein
MYNLCNVGGDEKKRKKEKKHKKDKKSKKSKKGSPVGSPKKQDDRFHRPYPSSGFVAPNSFGNVTRNLLQQME